MTLIGVVLAGGASTRMGADKATLMVDGETLLNRTVRVLSEAGCSEVIVAGGTHTGNWELVPDLDPFAGPLAGFLVALDHIQDPDALVLLVGCDHPKLDHRELSQLADLLNANPDVDIVLPILNGRAQPLHAPYRARVALHLRQAYRRGERSLLRALSGASIFELPADPTNRSYADADTPQDFETLATDTSSA